MLQAVDLNRLQADLEENDLVLIEIFDQLWPRVEAAMTQRLGQKLRTASVFMTAIDPKQLQSLPDDQSRAAQIRTDVDRILQWRNKDRPDKVQTRADSAADEVLAAIAPGSPYSKVFHSAPEGPDGKDEWTRESEPVGQAAHVLRQFVWFILASKTRPMVYAAEYDRDGNLRGGICSCGGAGVQMECEIDEVGTNQAHVTCYYRCPRCGRLWGEESTDWT
jgi:hypothetical protein